MSTFPSGFMYEAAGRAQQPMGASSPYVGQNMGFANSYPPRGIPFHTQGGRGLQQQPKKQPVSVINVHCEICSITCSSEQAFKEHLAGQKHRKKLAVQSYIVPGKPTMNVGSAVGSVASNIPSTAGKANKAAQQTAVLFCDLCNVSCCGAQVFAGHVQGAKHQKALKNQAQNAKVAARTVASSANQVNIPPASESSDDANSQLPLIGEEFMSTLTNESGNAVSFYCNLCKCALGDPRGRLAHLRGQRHRLNYKKQVDHSFYLKPTPRTARKHELRDLMRFEREDHWQKMDTIAARVGDGFHSPGIWMLPALPPVNDHQRQNFSVNVEDKYIFGKRDSVRMSRKEFESINDMAIICEKALKLVSDIIAKEDNILLLQPVDKSSETPVKQEDDSSEANNDEKPVEAQSKTANPAEAPSGQEHVALEKLDRAVRGVMRVGRLASGILLAGDCEFELVVLSKDKPTWPFLERIAAEFTDQLVVVAPNLEFNVQTYDDGCIRVIREAKPELTATITVTSPTVRNLLSEDDRTADADPTPDPENMLPKDKCLEALAQLRRTKWFQVRCSQLMHCEPILRVLRDLCKRNTCWSVLSDWAQELLVEKCICYAGFDQGPSNVLRTVFGCIASGLLTSDGVGLYDPCEKNPVDALGHLTRQQREDLTASAQNAVRLVAFRQVYKILGMEKFFKRPLYQHIKRGLTDASNNAQPPEKKPKEEESTVDIPLTTDNTGEQLPTTVPSTSEVTINETVNDVVVDAK